MIAYCNMLQQLASGVIFIFIYRTSLQCVEQVSRLQQLVRIAVFKHWNWCLVKHLIYFKTAVNQEYWVVNLR